MTRISLRLQQDGHDSAEVRTLPAALSGAGRRALSTDDEHCEISLFNCG